MACNMPISKIYTINHSVSIQYARHVVPSFFCTVCLDHHSLVNKSIGKARRKKINGQCVLMESMSSSGKSRFEHVPISSLDSMNYFLSFTAF